MSDEDQAAFQIMAELSEVLPEVPVPILTAVAQLCIENDAEARTEMGFKFVESLNHLKLISLMAHNISEAASGDSTIAVLDDDGSRPRFSRYGYRLDRPPQPGDEEVGQPIFADKAWVGIYTIHNDDTNTSVEGLRFVLSYDDLPLDSNHPDVIEWWISSDNAARLARNINHLIENF